MQSNPGPESTCVDVIEVDDARGPAGALFEKAFDAPIPDQPRHFVLRAQTGDAGPVTLGYVHFTRVEDFYLGGGMCVDSRAIRRLPKTVRKALAEQGGAAYSMLSRAVDELNDCDAVFGHVGHRLAYRIDLAVGFEPTRYPHLIVYWKRALDAAAQERIVEAANRQGPF